MSGSCFDEATFESGLYFSLLMNHPHERLPEIGVEGHQRIQISSVVVVGAGGLAHAVLPYFAAAGVRRLVIVDGDVVEESNLHRQILFTKNDIGTLKVAATQRYLSSQFPETQIEFIPEFLGKSLGVDQLPACDLIMDCSDNFCAGLSAEEYAVRYEIPMIYGKASRWEGQVTVINGIKDMRMASVFSGMNGSRATVACSSVGVMAPAVGSVGCVMATEALKILGGMQSELDGRLWTFDFLTCRSITVDVYDAPFSDQRHIQKNAPALNPLPLQKPWIIDVREHSDAADTADETLRIPFSEISENIHKIPLDRSVIFFCESGERARQALTIARFHGLKNGRATDLSEIALCNMKILAGGHEKM